MKRTLFAFLLVNLMVSACASVTVPTPTQPVAAAPTATSPQPPTPPATFTPPPTERPPTETPVPTPEVVSIPEELFPTYGTFLGYTKDNLTGIVVTRLPNDNQKYLMNFESKFKLKTDWIGELHILYPTKLETGEYVLLPVKEDFNTHQRVVTLKITPIKGKKAFQVSLQSLPHPEWTKGPSHGELGELNFDIILAYRGTGKKVLYDAIREIALRTRNSGPWPDEIIDD